VTKPGKKEGGFRTERQFVIEEAKKKRFKKMWQNCNGRNSVLARKNRDGSKVVPLARRTK